MRPLYYDRNGVPIELLEWARLAEDDDYRSIACTSVVDTADPAKAYHVSTVWIGINTALFVPLIFETAVFASESGESKGTQRYATEDQAREGHAAMVVSVCAEFTDPVVADIVGNEKRGAD